MNYNIGFTEKLAFGEEGEKQILEYLIENEFRNCFPMYQFSPKQSPILKTPLEDLISPDIITFKGKETIFVECKRKNNWVSGYNTNTEKETGVDTRLWKFYMKIVDITYNTLEIYFLHNEGLFKIVITPELLKEFRINPNIFRIGTMLVDGKQVRMIFFPYEKLIKLY